MSSVEIVGPRNTFDLAVETLQTTGLVHIEEIPLVESGTQGMLHRVHLSEAQAREKSAYEELVQLLDEATAHIPSAMARETLRPTVFREQYREWENRPLSSIASTSRALHAKVRSFVRRRRNLGDDLRVLSGYEEVIAALAPLVESHELPKDFEFVGVILKRKNRNASDLLERQLRKLTADQYRFFRSGLSGGRVAALVGFHKQFTRQVRAFIAEAGISEMRGPRYLRDKPFEQALAALEEDLASMRKAYQALLKEMEGFYTENGPKLLALQCVCRDRFSRLDATSKFAQTEHAFIIKGWAPGPLLGDLRARLSKACGEAVVVREVRPGGTGTPPVLLANPKPIRPFERLMGLLPLPRYGTIDPTSFVATFFPPIFGLMLGDVGYGLILAISAVMLYRLSSGRKIQKDLAIVLGYCAFYTLLFGFLFGELFGPVGHHIGLRPILLERFSLSAVDKGSALLRYLAIAVGVGVLHITWGLVLGIINARKSGERRQALDCGARIVGLFALFLLVGRLVQFLPPVFLSFGVIALVIFLVLMVYQSLRHPLHGMMLPLELLSTVGNILSYARIMAVGMVSVVLAVLANKFGGMIENVALAGVVVALVHALNLALGIFDPTIQGLRLHYVEFFSKFYLAGGRRYTPFRKMGGDVA